jgi:hypothetical protein
MQTAWVAGTRQQGLPIERAGSLTRAGLGLFPVLRTPLRKRADALGLSSHLHTNKTTEGRTDTVKTRPLTSIQKSARNTSERCAVRSHRGAAPEAGAATVEGRSARGSRRRPRSTTAGGRCRCGLCVPPSRFDRSRREASVGRGGHGGEGGWGG